MKTELFTLGRAISRTIILNSKARLQRNVALDISTAAAIATAHMVPLQTKWVTGYIDF